MNWDTVKGQWKQVQGKVKQKWGQLTDDDLTTINGQKEQLLGKLHGLRSDRGEEDRK